MGTQLELLIGTVDWSASIGPLQYGDLWVAELCKLKLVSPGEPDESCLDYCYLISEVNKLMLQSISWSDHKANQIQGKGTTDPTSPWKECEQMSKSDFETTT